MMQFVYLIALLVSLLGMVALDHRFKLAFFVNARRSTVVLALALVIFIAWDLAGIGLGIFSKGVSAFSLPIELLPELPLEELFFLVLLNYLSLLTYRYISRRLRT